MHGIEHAPYAINNMRLFEAIFGECLSTIAKIVEVLFESVPSAHRLVNHCPSLVYIQLPKEQWEN